MAIYHCCLKIIKRGMGKSVVGAAAYRSGEEITNDYDGITPEKAASHIVKFFYQTMRRQSFLIALFSGTRLKK